MNVNTIAVFLRRHQYIVAFIGFTVLWLFVVVGSRTIWSGYHLFDDHEIFGYQTGIRSATTLSQKIELLEHKFFVGQYTTAIRFRPIHYIHRTLLTMWLDFNLTAWSWYMVSLGIITSWLLFLFGKLQRWSFIEASLLVVFTLVGPQSVIYWRLGTPETLAMFLFAITLVCIAMSVHSQRFGWLWQSLIVVAGVLTSLSKESFVIMMPAIILLNIILHYQKLYSSITQLAKRVGAVTGIFIGSFIAELFYVITNLQLLQGTGGDAVGVNGFQPIQYFMKLLDLLSTNSYGEFIILAFGLVLLTGIVSQEQLIHRLLVVLKEIGGTIFISVIIILPQLVLYAASGLVNRYYIPATFGVAFLVCSLLAYAREKNLQYNLRIALLAFCCIVMFFSYYNVTADASAYAVDGRANMQLLNSITQCAKSTESVIIVVNELIAGESVDSVQEYLQVVHQYPTIHRYPVSITPTSEQTQQLLTAKAIVLISEQPAFLQNTVAFKPDQYQQIDAGAAMLYCKQ